MHQRELAAEQRLFARGPEKSRDEVTIELAALEAKERAWHARQARVAEMHRRELAAEHRAFAQGPDH